MTPTQRRAREAHLRSVARQCHIESRRTRLSAQRAHIPPHDSTVLVKSPQSPNPLPAKVIVTPSRLARQIREVEKQQGAGFMVQLESGEMVFLPVAGKGTDWWLPEESPVIDQPYTPPSNKALWLAIVGTVAALATATAVWFYL